MCVLEAKWGNFMSIMIITLQLTLRPRLGRAIDTDKLCRLTPSVLSRIVRLSYDGHLTFPTVHSEHFPGQWPRWYFITLPRLGHHHQPIAAAHSGSTTDRQSHAAALTVQTSSLFPHICGADYIYGLAHGCFHLICHIN